MESQISIWKKMIFDLRKIDFRPANKLKKRHSTHSLFISHIALSFHELTLLKFHSHNALNNKLLQSF